MRETSWTVLSEWHNAWLAAGPDERRRLRDRLAREHPDLKDEADALAAAICHLNRQAFDGRVAASLGKDTTPLRPRGTSAR